MIKVYEARVRVQDTEKIQKVGYGYGYGYGYRRDTVICIYIFFIISNTNLYNFFL